MQHKQVQRITRFEWLRLQATLFDCDELKVIESDDVCICGMNIALYVHKDLTSYQLERQYDRWRFVPNSNKNGIWLGKIEKCWQPVVVKILNKCTSVCVCLYIYIYMYLLSHQISLCCENAHAYLIINLSYSRGMDYLSLKLNSASTCQQVPSPYVKDWNSEGNMFIVQHILNPEGNI